MAKKHGAYFICLNIVFLTLFACNGMAALFHGPKPEEAVPLFTIGFDANGAEGAAPSARTVNSGTVITMPGEEGLSKGANVFTGWNVSKSGGGTTYPPESPYTVTADQTFYAQWTDPAQVYTVTYNANGASGTPPSPQKAVQNGSIIVADKGSLTNTNKNFAGWNTAADGMGTNYNAGAALTVTGNITLYAQWVDPSVQRYTVTYYANGAAGTPPSAQTVNEGASITLPGAGGLTYSGKTFTGWNTAANGSGPGYAAGAGFTVNGNTSFYAQWANEPVTPPGATLAEKFAYIAGQFDNGAIYDIAINADESLAPTTVMTSGKNVTIILHSLSAQDIKTVFLSGLGYLFTVSSNITLKFENIKLQGSSGNNTSLIKITSGGTLILDMNSEVTENKNNGSYGTGGGILVDGGTLIMRAGKISNNATWKGGGIFVAANGRFTMYGGTISGNKADGYSQTYGVGSGGGVHIANGGYFTKTSLEVSVPSGIIYGNDVGTELSNTSYVNSSGNAVYYVAPFGGNKKRNTTLGGYDEISTDNVNIGWE